MSTIEVNNVHPSGGSGTVTVSASVGTVVDGPSLSVYGNTILGNAAADTVTVNATTCSVPNNLAFLNGNVGVGAVPTTQFHVGGTHAWHVNTTTGKTYMSRSAYANPYIENYSGYAKFTTGNGHISLFPGGADKYVGIGTAAPTRPLQVVGVQNELIRIENTQADGSAAVGYRTSYGTDVNWATGINGADGSYVISNAASVGTNDRLVIDSSGNTIIAGNLTVNGTTSTVNSTTVTVDDKNIELGSVASPTDSTADLGGITLKGATDKTILWRNSTDRWHFNQGIGLTAGHVIVEAGNVGIGTAAPSRPLNIVTTENDAIRIENTVNGGDCAIGYRTSYNDPDVNWATGIDGSDSSFRIAYGAALGTNDRLKISTAGAVTVGTSLTIASSTTVTGILDEDNMASDSATALATQQSIKAYVTSQVTAQDLDITTDDSVNTAIDLDSEILTLAGGTGITTSASGNAVTFVTNAAQAHVTSVGTLTSLAVTGDLTVDTNTLKVDSTNNKIGIGIASPADYNDSADSLVIYKAGNTGMTIATGVTDWGSIYFADGTGGDSHQGAVSYHHHTDKLYFGTAGTDTRVAIDSTGKVGIGVTDPDAYLEVLSTTTQLKASYDTNSFATVTVADNSHTTIATGESGNLTLDAELIKVGAATHLQTLPAGSVIIQDGSLGISKNSVTNTVAPEIIFAKGAHADAGSTATAVADGEVLGELIFQGTDGAGLEAACKIQGVVDGGPVTGGDGTDMPGGIVLFTSPEGESTPVERMKVTSNGYIRLKQITTDAHPSADAGYAFVYAKVDSGTTELYVSDAAANSTKLSPHDKDNEWEFFSSNQHTGRTICIKMEKLLKRLNDKFGEPEWYQEIWENPDEE